jgi:hypothetical protein
MYSKLYKGAVSVAKTLIKCVVKNEFLWTRWNNKEVKREICDEILIQSWANVGNTPRLISTPRLEAVLPLSEPTLYIRVRQFILGVVMVAVILLLLLFIVII